MKIQNFVMRLSQVLIPVNLYLCGYMSIDAGKYLSQNALDVGMEFWEMAEFCIINTILSGINYLIYAIVLYCIYKYLKNTLPKETTVQTLEKTPEINILSENEEKNA